MIEHQLLRHQKRHLTARISSAFILNIIKNGFTDCEQLSAICSESVKCTAFYQTFNCSAVHISAVEPFAEIKEIFIRIVYALRDDFIYEISAEIFNGKKSVTDIVSADRKMKIAFVDIRWQHTDSEPFALGNV